MSNPSGQATVIVVNIDADLAEFYGFAQLHAIDLIGSSPPVWVWTLASSEIAPSGTVEHVLGRWPRHFLAVDALGEALAEAVEEVLGRRGEPTSVGIIVLARGTKSLLVGAENEGEATAAPSIRVLDALGKVMARDRGYRSRIWKIAALLDGPQDIVDHVGDLLADPRDGADEGISQDTSIGFDTIAVINSAIDGQARLANNTTHANLRFIVDMIRGGGELWSALRPSGQGSRPRILWLRPEGTETTNRPLELRRAIAVAVEARLRASADPKAEEDTRLRGVIQKALDGLTQEVEPANRVMSLDVELKSLPIRPRFSNATARRSIDQAQSELRSRLVEHYRDAAVEIHQLQDQGDARYASLRDEVDSLQLPVTDASLSGHLTATVQAEIDKVDEYRKTWSQEAKTARRSLLHLHSDAQGRPDPVDPGELALDTFVPWQDFDAALADAKTEVESLPPNQMSWFWVWAPALILLIVVAADFLNGPKRQGFTNAAGLADLARPNPLWFGIALAVVVVIVYVFISRRFRTLYRIAATNAAAAAQKAVVSLNEALSATQVLMANARAAPLAEQLAARLGEAIKGTAQRFTADFELLKAAGQSSVDAKTMAALETVIEQVPIDRWVREMTRAWVDADPPHVRGQLAVRNIPEAHIFAIDQAALRQDRLGILSTWAVEDFAMTVVPLLPGVSGGAKGAPEKDDSPNKPGGRRRSRARQ